VTYFNNNTSCSCILRSYVFRCGTRHFDKRQSDILILGISRVLPNGGYVNNGFKTEGYQNERYQNRGFHDNIYDKDDFDFESGRHKTDNNNFYNGVF
jgi:hypothetical protein